MMATHPVQAQACPEQNIPDKAVKAAGNAYWNHRRKRDGQEVEKAPFRLDREFVDTMRAALAAALPHLSGEGEKHRQLICNLRILSKEALLRVDGTGHFLWVNKVTADAADALETCAAIASPPSPQGEWRDIATAPDAPVQVEFFYGNASLMDQTGEVITLPAYRDERRELGYWDGEDWHHCGTGHRVNEFGDNPPEWLPTHWRPLPSPPLMDGFECGERGTAANPADEMRPPSTKQGE